ncbi:hypothetical protein MF271_08835 [Deinococcus sp. KNUC1210]|uniref:hypothetical protein n=1 Tax=Deinococcus sp. KNUC1210 TaxID=2917691 RepID=UPI001EF05142|nr:hypothetical protein [Deinococcus sp. KNUC1210]ULH16660.1 hypothetical protein MF271_08835 [Deinococcus sp. KNUC1210]
MLVPDQDHTLLTVAPAEPGDHVHLIVVGLHDTREEPIWVEVIEWLQESVHRARVVTAARLFPNLSAGAFVFFRPEHIVRVVMGGGGVLRA